MEIKNGKKSKLTQGELECKKDLESVGVKYWVIYSIEDALKMIGAEIVEDIKKADIDLSLDTLEKDTLIKVFN